MRNGIFALLILLSGCSSLLPSGDSVVVSQWQSFDQAMSAYQAIEPFQTEHEQLAELGFSPDSGPNVRIIRHGEIIERLIAVPTRHYQSLPSGLQQCLEQMEACYGHQVKVRVTHDRRYGNVLADLFNFRRKIETRGWEFQALIVLIDRRVVYKTWSGTPEIQEYQEVNSPLGPLQSIGPAVVPKPEF